MSYETNILDLVCNSLRELDLNARTHLLSGISLKKFTERTKQIYLYLTEMYEQGKDELSIPAKLIAAVLDLSYRSSRGISRFKSTWLEVYGKEGHDWVVKKKNDVIQMFSPSIKLHPSVAFTETGIEFKIPGAPNEHVLIRKGAGNASKFAFVTPTFAWHLVRKSSANTAIMLLEMHFEVVNILKEFVTKSCWENAVSRAFSLAQDKIVLKLKKHSPHNEIRDALAQHFNGRTEVRNRFGIADVETLNEVIEVKPALDWAHGVGQVLSYASATGKSA